MKKKIIIWSVVLLLCAIAAVSWFYFFKFSPKVGKNSALTMENEVSVQKPRAEKVVLTSSYIGMVQAVNHTEIVPYISGYVIKIDAKGGQVVKKGEVLAVLKQEEYLAELSAADAALFSAQADFVNSRIKYRRLQKAGTEAVSLTEIDDAKTAYLTAAGKLKEAKAAYEKALLNFKYTYLTAPFDGVLGNVSLSLGEYISPQSKNLMQLVQYNPIRVVFSITDKDYLQGFLHDKKAKIILQQADGTIFSQNGEIKYSANEADEKTGSVAVYAEFANPEGKLLPNTYVNVLIEREYPEAVLIDKSSVIMRDNGYFALVVQKDELKEKPLKIIGETGGKWVAENNFTDDEFLALGMTEESVGKKVKIKFVNAEQ